MRKSVWRPTHNDGGAKLLIALIVCCCGAWLDEILTMFKSSQQPMPAQCGSIVGNLSTTWQLNQITPTISPVNVRYTAQQSGQMFQIVFGNHLFNLSFASERSILCHLYFQLKRIVATLERKKLASLSIFTTVVLCLTCVYIVVTGIISW